MTPAYNVPAQPVIPIPLPVYMICIFIQHGPVEIGFTAVSLIYGKKNFPSPTPETPSLIIPQTF